MNYFSEPQRSSSSNGQATAECYASSQHNSASQRDSETSPLVEEAEGEMIEKDGTPDCKWAPVSVPHFVPAWEGLRGIAVLLTCTSHIDKLRTSFHHYAGTGGVTMFFVLSGFLITGVLARQQAELQRSASKVTFRHLRRFYMDRTVRLYPALLLMVILTGAMSIFRGNARFSMRFLAQVALTLGYVSNLNQVVLQGKPRYIWKNTWSLSVEEQFYVLWSLALPFVLLLKARGRTILLAVLITSSFSLHLCNAAEVGGLPSWLLYQHAPTGNFWKMLVGVLARLSPLPPWVQSPLVTWAGLATLLLSFLATASATPLDLTSIGFSKRFFGHNVYHEMVAVLATVLIILGTVRQGNSLLEAKWIRFVGRVSYAFYLYQSPLLYFQESHRGYSGVAVTALAFVAAAVSTMYVEEPLRDLYKARQKRKLGRRDIEYVSIEGDSGNRF